MAKLEEKAFETVRLDTIDQIRDGFVKGNIRSFKSPSNASVSPGRLTPTSLNGNFAF